MNEIKRITYEDLLKCEVCNDGSKKWLVTPDGKPYRCNCFNKRKTIESMRKMGISERELNKTFSNYKTDSEFKESILAAVRQYASDFVNDGLTDENALLLLGQVGCGKTHLAMAAFMYILTNGDAVKGYIMKWVDCVTDLKQTVISDPEHYKRIMNKIKTTDCLFIDDLFKGSITETDIKYAYDIINYRYEKALPIICTCEKNVQEIINIDEAVGSRLAEMAKGHIIEMQGIGNYRLSK